MDLFEAQMGTGSSTSQPLAERLRPKSLDEFSGQAPAIAALKAILAQPSRMPNLIFWGPPGCGKTTLANLVARASGFQLISLNAVAAGAKELREQGRLAHERKIQGFGHTIVFIDEIHRLNRSQQDVLLPFCEKGDFILIGATTENPSYELNSALLSRSKVIRLKSLVPESLSGILERGLKALELSREQAMSAEVQQALLISADGDGRRLLSMLENIDLIVRELGRPLELSDWPKVEDQVAPVRYDKNRDEHYDTISAFIKSVRGSDPDAAIYYLARMLAGGEDPVFLARRLVILASEDIGNADPRGLPLAVAGLQAVELVGMPEAAICLAQVTTFLSSAPKSNASYTAIKTAQALVEKTGTLPIPLALRSSQTQLSRQFGHGENYQYAHDGPTGWKKMTFLPQEIESLKFYEPVDRGFEKTIRQYLAWMKGEGKSD